MSKPLEGKRILLTGAAGGIGSAIARQLGNHGARLLLTDVDEMGLKRIAEETGHSASACNLDNQQSRAELLWAVERQFGELDGLVYCAGINHFGLHDVHSDELIERMVRVNLVSPIQLTRHLLPLLELGKEPVIVNLGSVFGHIGFPGFSLYCATKFGLHGYTEALRRELATGPIRVVWISPRATSTGMNAGVIDAMNAELRVNYDKPERVAQVVAEVVAHPVRERVIGFPEKIFARINQVFPGVVDGSLVRQLPVIQKYNSIHKESHS